MKAVPSTDDSHIKTAKSAKKQNNDEKPDMSKQNLKCKIIGQLVRQAENFQVYKRTGGESRLLDSNAIHNAKA